MRGPYNAYRGYCHVEIGSLATVRDLRDFEEILAEENDIRALSIPPRVLLISDARRSFGREIADVSIGRPS
jgi:hypothetical protein